MSFNPWTDCGEEEEIPVSLSRQRRDRSVQHKVNKLEKRIEELKGSCTKSKNHDITAVCIDFNGKMRRMKKFGNIHSMMKNKCVQCVCQDQDIRCSLVQC